MFLQTNGEQLEEKYDAVKSVSVPSREGVYIFIYINISNYTSSTETNQNFTASSLQSNSYSYDSN